MARITVEDCLEHVENRFKLVLLASKRARQLARGMEPLLPWENDKPTVVALREIADNLVNEEMMRQSTAAQAEGEGAELVEDELAALYSEISREMSQAGFDKDRKQETPEEPGKVFGQGMNPPDEQGDEQGDGTEDRASGQPPAPDSGMWNSSWQLLDSPDAPREAGSDESTASPDPSSEEEQGR